MYSIMVNGKRVAKSLGTRDEQQALKNFKRVRNNIAGQIDRGEFERSTSATVTLDELLDDYLRHIRANGHKSASIIESVIGRVRKAQEFGNGEKATRRVATLTTADFNRYRSRLVERGKVSHSTVNNHLAYMRAALKREEKNTPSRVGKVPHIPIVRVSNTRDGFLEYDDHTSVLDALPQSLKCLFIVAYHSGCRMGEVLNMRWSDVDRKNQVIRLPKTKNGKQRNLPFWGSIEAHLTAQKAYRDMHHPEQERLFFWMAEDVALTHGGVRNLPGSPIQDFRASWSDTVKAAHEKNPNVPANLLFHDLRRSAVRLMVQECGIPEAQAMLISGHETRSMLDRYNIVSLKNVQDAGAKLDAWHKAKQPAKPTKKTKVVAIGSKSVAS